MLLETNKSRVLRDKELLEKYIKENNVSMIEKMKAKLEVVKWLSDSNTKYHLTITFPKFTDEVWTRKLLNTFIKSLNRSIYKKRYSESKSCLKGFVIRERSIVMATDHYHMLLVDDGWLPDKDKMNHLIDKTKIFLQIDKQTGKKKEHYIEDAFLQDYYNFDDDGLERYLSKQFQSEYIPIQQIKDSIGILDFGDVLFGRDRFSSYH